MGLGLVVRNKFIMVFKVNSWREFIIFIYNIIFFYINVNS